MNRSVIERLRLAILAAVSACLPQVPAPAAAISIGLAAITPGAVPVAAGFRSSIGPIGRMRRSGGCFSSRYPARRRSRGLGH
jgi:hypothetical protein